MTDQTNCCSSSNTSCCGNTSSVLTNELNTLAYTPALCINCGMCTIVCPHNVFKNGKRVAILANAESCMECGACQLNCPSGAIQVESGVGCATAMIMSALKGQKEVACGDDDCGCC